MEARLSHAWDLILETCLNFSTQELGPECCSSLLTPDAGGEIKSELSLMWWATPTIASKGSRPGPELLCCLLAFLPTLAFKDCHV